MTDNKKKLIGVLLINLGSTEAPTGPAVLKFTSDLLEEKTQDEPFFKRLFLTKIFPYLIYKKLTEQYRRIWFKEGSPLLVYLKRIADKLQESLGPGFKVQPATVLNKDYISNALANLTIDELSQLIVIPLFPQYSEVNKGYIEKMMHELLKLSIIPDVTLLSRLTNTQDYAATMCEIGKKYDPATYDHVLFSFHSLPVKSDKIILDLYNAQCIETSSLIVAKFNLLENQYTTCFQSREGKGEWLQPYTEDVLRKLVAKGKKKVLIFCLSWPSDCLETLYSVGVYFNELFKDAGGETLDLVPCVNDHPMWVEALKKLVLENVKQEASRREAVLEYGQMR